MSRGGINLRRKASPVHPEPTLRVTHFRVAWRRPHWTAATTSKSRVFFEMRHAVRFLDILKSRGALLWFRLDVRDAVVGEWRLWKEGGRNS